MLFGRSGYGKTSLLHAGLFPRLRGEDFLPVYLRLDFSPEAPPLLAQVHAKLAASAAENGIEAPSPAPDTALWTFFHARTTEFWGPRNRLVTPVLVFDQFEEIFTLVGDVVRPQAEALLAQIADLAENRPPPEFAAAIDSGAREVADTEFGEVAVKLVLSFREDYLARFEALRTRMPSIMQSRLAIAPMDETQGLDAVLKSGRRLIAPDVAQEVIGFVADRRRSGATGRREVEPALLSVVCRELNNRRIRTGQPQITHDLLDTATDAIIADFYAASVADATPGLQRFIEDDLVTLDGFRKNCALGEALRKPGVTADGISLLVARRILRIDDRFGTRQVELTHDLLTHVIRVRRDAREARERSAAEIAQARAQRRRTVRLGVAALCAVLVLGAVAAGFAILWNRERIALAERNRTLRDLQASEAKADLQRHDALGEREAFIGELNQVLSIASDQLRFLPGAALPLRDVSDNVKGFLGRLTEQVQASTLRGDASSVTQLSFTSRMLTAQLDVLLGHLTTALAGLQEAGRDLDKLAAGSDGQPGDMQTVRRLRAQLQLRYGMVWRNAEDRPRAAAAFAQAAALAREAIAADPSGASDEPRQNLFLALTGTVEVLLQAAKDDPAREATIAEAARLNDEARTLIAMPTGGATLRPQARRQLANVMLREGEVLVARGDYAGARAKYAEAFHIFEGVPEGRSRSSFGQIMLNMVRVHDARAAVEMIRAREGAHAASEYDEPLALLDQAYQGFLKMRTDDPVNAFWVAQTVLTGEFYAETLRAAGAAGGLDHAIALLRDALAQRRKLAELDPAIPAFQLNVATAAEKLAEALAEARDIAGARAAYQDARIILAARPDYAGRLAALDRKLAALPPATASQ